MTMRGPAKFMLHPVFRSLFKIGVTLFALLIVVFKASHLIAGHATTSFWWVAVLLTALVQVKELSALWQWTRQGEGVGRVG